MGGDIQGTDKGGSEGTGPWGDVKSGGIDCATIWEQGSGDDRTYTECA